MKWITVKGTGQLSGVSPSTNGVTATVAKSNCTTAASGAYGATLPATTASWAGVYLTTPGTTYSLCSLTAALELDNYVPRWGAVDGPQRQATVHDYLAYVLNGAGGQAVLAGAAPRDLQVLPADVQTAAQAGL